MKLKKVSMNLSEQSLTNISELSVLMNSNRTIVISNSLKITKLIVEAVDKGSKIIIKDEEGNAREIQLMI